MIRAIIFDFDGVLVESAGIKTEAFRSMFSAWSDKIEEIVSYHLNNMGVSRYVKFKHFHEKILGLPYSDQIGVNLGKQFSKIVLDQIKQAPFVDGTERFLEDNYKEYLFFIASGTPQEELDDIVSSRSLNRYFKSVFGTPATKDEIIEMILSKFQLERRQVAFVGDADSDRNAAENSGILFVARLTEENTSLNKEKWTIRNITELKSIINGIEKEQG
jgi:phosphoglycolate phosphatase-like HAD superfamily hydrolase